MPSLREGNLAQPLQVNALHGCFRWLCIAQSCRSPEFQPAASWHEDGASRANPNDSPGPGPNALRRDPLTNGVSDQVAQLTNGVSHHQVLFPSCAAGDSLVLHHSNSGAGLISPDQIRPVDLGDAQQLPASGRAVAMMRLDFQL